MVACDGTPDHERVNAIEPPRCQCARILKNTGPAARSGRMEPVYANPSVVTKCLILNTS